MLISYFTTISFMISSLFLFATIKNKTETSEQCQIHLENDYSETDTEPAQDKQNGD